MTRIPGVIAATFASAALAAVPAATATATGHSNHRRNARAAAGCADANARVGRTPTRALRGAVVCLINEQRALRHLPPLREAGQLDRSAQGWTNTMVATDQFTHGTNFAARISATGYHWRAAGENIATGYATPSAVVRGWMASKGHCQNILNPAYRNVGTGVDAHPVRGWASGGGTWTQDFGLRINQSPASGNSAPARGCPY